LRLWNAGPRGGSVVSTNLRGRRRLSRRPCRHPRTSANIRGQAEMRDGGNVGGLSASLAKGTKIQRHILSRNNRVGMIRNHTASITHDRTVLELQMDDAAFRASPIAVHRLPVDGSKGAGADVVLASCSTSPFFRGLVSPAPDCSRAESSVSASRDPFQVRLQGRVKAILA
jgi:hypothetical protein